MNIRQLQLFVEIARSGSFSSAAAVLGSDQPSLSRQVKQLEDEIGARLFFRTGRGVKLTEVGDDLLDISNRYINDMSDLRQRVQAERAHPRGRVCLGVVQFLGATFAPHLLMRFREAYPDIAVHVTGGNSGVIHEWLLNGRIDIGIIYDAGRSHELSGEPILREKTCLFGSRALAQEYGIDTLDEVPLQELARLPLILTSRHHGLRRAMEHQAQRAGVRLSVTYEVDNLATIKALCRAGAAFAPLPCGAYAQDSAQEQGFVAPITPGIESVFSMVFARHRPLTSATRELAGVIRTEIRDYVHRAGHGSVEC